MARKTLLTEGEIRQFMKLANLTPLGHGRIEEMGFGVNEELPPEEEEMEMGAEMPPGPEDEDELGGLEDEAPEELEMDAEMGDAEGDVGGGMISVDDFMSALETALEEVTGETVSAEVDDDLGALDDEEMGMEPEMGDEMGDEMGMDMGPEEEEEELPPGNRGVYENQDAIVNEVARRVAARLGKTQKKTALADQLAERILQRLTKTK
jgi:hypothetical protein